MYEDKGSNTQKELGHLVWILVELRQVLLGIHTRYVLKISCLFITINTKLSVSLIIPTMTSTLYCVVPFYGGEPPILLTTSMKDYLL